MSRASSGYEAVVLLETLILGRASGFDRIFYLEQMGVAQTDFLQSLRPRLELFGIDWRDPNFLRNSFGLDMYPRIYARATKLIA